VHFLISVFAPGVKRRGRRVGSGSHFFAALVGLPSAALVATGDEVETNARGDVSSQVRRRSDLDAIEGKPLTAAASNGYLWPNNHARQSNAISGKRSHYASP
jgi:hypothetical protein